MYVLTGHVNFHSAWGVEIISALCSAIPSHIEQINPEMVIAVTDFFFLFLGRKNWIKVKWVVRLSALSQVLTPPPPNQPQADVKTVFLYVLHVLTFTWPYFPCIYIVVAAPFSFQGYCHLLPEPPHPPYSSIPYLQLPRGGCGWRTRRQQPNRADWICRKTGLNEFILLQLGWGGWDRRWGAKKVGEIKLTWFQPCSPLPDSSANILPLGWPRPPDKRFL